jgi:hypothetical protein
MCIQFRVLTAPSIHSRACRADIAVNPLHRLLFERLRRTIRPDAHCGIRHKHTSTTPGRPTLRTHPGDSSAKVTQHRCVRNAHVALNRELRLDVQLPTEAADDGEDDAGDDEDRREDDDADKPRQHHRSQVNEAPNLLRDLRVDRVDVAGAAGEDPGAGVSSCASATHGAGAYRDVGVVSSQRSVEPRVESMRVWWILRDARTWPNVKRANQMQYATTATPSRTVYTVR